MLKRRNFFRSYLSVLFLCVREVGIVMGNSVDLGSKAVVEQIWPRYQLCSSALRCDRWCIIFLLPSSLIFLLLHAPGIDCFRLH